MEICAASAHAATRGKTLNSTPSPLAICPAPVSRAHPARNGSHAGTKCTVACRYTKCESPMGGSDAAKSIRAARRPRSPAAKAKSESWGRSASWANSVQPPERRSVSSPRPSHTASICGATTMDGNFSEAHKMSPGKRMRTAVARVVRKSNPQPTLNSSNPARYASAVRPGIHGATGCHTMAKSPTTSATTPRPIRPMANRMSPGCWLCGT